MSVIGIGIVYVLWKSYKIYNSNMDFEEEELELVVTNCYTYIPRTHERFKTKKLQVSIGLVWSGTFLRFFLKRFSTHHLKLMSLKILLVIEKFILNF